MIRRVPGWLLLVPLCGNVAAQVFEHYTEADAPALTSVHALLQEPGGHLWAATGEGLVRYDGEHFRTYYHDDRDTTSIPHDQVERLHLAPDGRIWTTSFNGGLAVYDPGKDRFFTWRQLTGRADTTAAHATRAILALSSDSILVGAADAGLWLCLTRTGVQVRVPGWLPVRGELVERIVRERGAADRLLVLTSHRLLRLDRERMHLVEVSLPITRDQGVGFPATFTDLLQEDRGGLWLATWGGGLWHVDAGRTKAVQYLTDAPPYTASRNIVHRLVGSGDGQLLAGTQRGLQRLDTVKGGFTRVGGDPGEPTDLPARNVADLLVLPDGLLWVGRSGGLSQCDPAANRFERVFLREADDRPPVQLPATGVVEVDGRLLVGTPKGLLVETSEGPVRFPGPPNAQGEGRSPQVLDLLRTRTGSVVAFTPQGILEVDLSTGRLRPILPATFREHGPMAHLSVLEDHEGMWWIGRQHRGVYRVDPMRDRTVLFSEEGPEHRRLSSSAWCQGIAEDAQHRIWVSAYGHGLDRISPDRERVDHFRAADHRWLRTGKVWDVAIDREDRLWIGTNGEGLIITPASDPGGPGTVRLARAEGLPNLISTVYADREGTLWVGGPSGLFRVDPGDLSIRPLGRPEGLPHTDLHHADIRDHPSGRLTIPLHDGLVMVRKSDLDEGPGPFTVALQEVLVQGVPPVSDTAVGRLRRIVLQPGQNLVEVRYGAIAFSLRDRIRLAHQLEGVDPRPVPVGASGRAVYTGLSIGTHHLHVLDLGGDGRTPQVVRELTIEVLPLWWQRGWVRLLGALVLAVGVAALVRWRLRTVHAREQLVAAHERRVAELEMEALRAQMNPHFLFNSLNAINRYIVKNEPRTASGYLTRFARLMRNVLQHSKEPLVPLKDELATLDLYIGLEAMRFEHRFTAVTEVELDDDTATLMVPPMLLQPYVENAIWHGLMHREGGGGLLTLRVHREGETLVFEVQDNGVGRAAASERATRDGGVRRSMGMRITHERMELARLMHGLHIAVQVVDLYDTEGRPAGTRVVVRMSR